MTAYYLMLNFILIGFGILLIALHRPDKIRPIRNWAILIIGLQIWLTLEMYLTYDLVGGGIQYQLRWAWAGFTVLLGCDGMSILFLFSVNLILLCSLLFHQQETTANKASILTLLFCDLAANGLITAQNWQPQLAFLGLLLFSLYAYLLLEKNARVDLIRRFSKSALKGYFCFILGYLLIYQTVSGGYGEPNYLMAANNRPDFIWALAAFLLLMGMAYLTPLFPFENWFCGYWTLLTNSEKIISASLLNQAMFYLIVRIVSHCLPLASSIAWLAIIWGIADLFYGSFLGWQQKDNARALGHWRVAQSGLLLSGIGCFAATCATPFRIGNGVVFLVLASGLIPPLLLIWEETKNVTAVGDTVHPVNKRHVITNLIFWFALGIPGSAVFMGYLLLFLGVKNIPSGSFILCLWTIGLLINGASLGRHWWVLLSRKQTHELMPYNRRIVFWLLIITLSVGGLIPSLWVRMIDSSMQRTEQPKAQRLDSK